MNPFLADAPRRPRERYWLHLLLFVLTLVSTTLVGAGLSHDFNRNRAYFIEGDLGGLLSLLTDPSALSEGLPFSLTLLTILLAHEMGHYFTCRYYGIDASLPYFIPFPSLIGTLGAFIRIRSAIFSKKQLFDIGIAGPLAGFVFILPALAIGVAHSKIIPGIATEGDLGFSSPIVVRWLELLIFPGVPANDIYLHPVARAAWVGVLATALNLMPMGQLDGGHILYSFLGEFHRHLTNAFILLLLPLGAFFSYSWFLWAILLFFFGRRHPRIYDNTPVTGGRRKLGALALVIFIVSFSFAPIRALAQ